MQEPLPNPKSLNRGVRVYMQNEFFLDGEKNNSLEDITWSVMGKQPAHSLNAVGW